MINKMKGFEHVENTETGRWEAAMKRRGSAILKTQSRSVAVQSPPGRQGSKAPSKREGGVRLIYREREREKKKGILIY